VKSGRAKDKSGAHSHFQGLKGLISGGSPSEIIIFKESSERCHNLSIILKKLVIISWLNLENHTRF
jgi:hypothetical protein